MGSNDDYSYWHQLEMSYSKGIKKHTCRTYNCPTDASYAICCRHSAARPHDPKSSPAQFVLLISHSIQNVMQCKEFFNYSVVYASCQYVVTRFCEGFGAGAAQLLAMLEAARQKSIPQEHGGDANGKH